MGVQNRHAHFSLRGRRLLKPLLSTGLPVQIQSPLIGRHLRGERWGAQAVTEFDICGAEAGKGDVELEDDDLDAGAWGDPDLDLEPHADADANGEADYERAEGEPEEGEDDEGGWEMEVLCPHCSCLVCGQCGKSV